MADDKAKRPGLFDPHALLEAQGRSIEAFTSAGRIVAEGMRTSADKQMALMQGLWKEAQGRGGKGAATDLDQQLAQSRALVETVVAETQALMQHLLEVQTRAMAVLNACVAQNMAALGGTAPDLASLRKTTSEAMEAASRQAATAVEEIQKRMAEMQAEVEPSPPPAEKPAAQPKPARQPRANATRRPRRK